MKEILILSTVDSMDLAQKIAHTLIEEGKAACVNIIPGIRSIYSWEKKICDDSELLLLIKSTEDNFEPVRKKIRQIHSYDTPEVIALPITAGDFDYLSWLRAQVGHGTAEKE